MALRNRSWTLSILLGVLLILNAFAAGSFERRLNEAEVDPAFENVPGRNVYPVPDPSAPGKAETVHRAASQEATKKTARVATAQATKPGTVHPTATDEAKEVVQAIESEKSVHVEDAGHGVRGHGHRGRGHGGHGRGHGGRHRGHGHRGGHGGGRRGGHH